MPSILIIDDDQSLRDSLRRTLQRAGYEVKEAGDGLQGLQVLKRDRIDLILLDIFMPGREGLEIIKELRRTNNNVRLIAISGGGRKDGVEVLKLARMFGAQRTLTKPFSRGRLLEAVWGEMLQITPAAGAKERLDGTD